MRRSVLIGDQDVDSWTTAAGLLRLAGLRVHVVANGPEVCDIIRRDRNVAVVVLDLNLPGMNGFELLRLLRGRFGAPRLPTETRIVAVSTRHEPEVERFALRLGSDVFVRKPVALVQLVRTIEKLVGRAAPLPPESPAAVGGAPRRFPGPGWRDRRASPALRIDKTVDAR